MSQGCGEVLQGEIVQLEVMQPEMFSPVTVVSGFIAPFSHDSSDTIPLRIGTR